MSTSPRRRPLSPHITRLFQATRFHDQSIASAYHTLIPILSRPLVQPAGPRGQDERAAAATPHLPTKATGA